MKQSDLFAEPGAATPKQKKRPKTKRKPTPEPTKAVILETDRDDDYVRPGLEDWDPWGDDPDTENIRKRLPW